jgi:hypothetical protein
VGTSLTPFDDVTMDTERINGVALFADGLQVDGDMFCGEGFVAEGEVRLPGAHIHGSLEFDEARLANEGASALNADGLEVDGDMFCTSRSIGGSDRSPTRAP